MPLGLPGAPLRGGGSGAGVRTRRRRPEARSTGEQPFPEGPTAEEALREAGRRRRRQGPDPATGDHQAARVSEAAPGGASLLCQIKMGQQIATLNDGPVRTFLVGGRQRMTS